MATQVPQVPSFLYKNYQKKSGQKWQKLVPTGSNELVRIGSSKLQKWFNVCIAFLWKTKFNKKNFKFLAGLMLNNISPGLFPLENACQCPKLDDSARLLVST